MSQKLVENSSGGEDPPRICLRESSSKRKVRVQRLQRRPEPGSSGFISAGFFSALLGTNCAASAWQSPGKVLAAEVEWPFPATAASSVSGVEV